MAAPQSTGILFLPVNQNAHTTISYDNPLGFLSFTGLRASYTHPRPMPIPCGLRNVVLLTFIKIHNKSSDCHSGGLTI